MKNLSLLILLIASLSLTDSLESKEIGILKLSDHKSAVTLSEITISANSTDQLIIYRLKDTKKLVPVATTTCNGPGRAALQNLLQNGIVNRRNVVIYVGIPKDADSYCISGATIAE